MYARVPIVATPMGRCVPNWVCAKASSIPAPVTGDSRPAMTASHDTRRPYWLSTLLPIVCRACRAVGYGYVAGVPETRVGVAHFLILARIASRVVQLTRLWQAQVDYGGSRPASDQRGAPGVLALLPPKIRVKAEPRAI